MEGLQSDLDTERRTYDHDMCLLELCSDMERVGVRVDVHRQKELSEAMATAADGYREDMRRIVKDPEFRVTNARIQKALYQTLAVRKLHFTEKGAPATGKVVIESPEVRRHGCRSVCHGSQQMARIDENKGDLRRLSDGDHVSPPLRQNGRQPLRNGPASGPLRVGAPRAEESADRGRRPHC